MHSSSRQTRRTPRTGSAACAARPGRGLRGLLLGLLFVTGALATGCGVEPGVDSGLGPSGVESGREPGQLQRAVCVPGDSGGDLGCGCTLNDQCSGFDDETRALVCDVPAMGGGKCTDCLALAAGAGARPVGCSCTTDSDCTTGLVCNGRTCQKLRSRGEFCVRDTDCGSDMLGAMGCLPTKSWCGPLPDGYYCDFQTDCLSGTCRAGSCTSGAAGSPCSLDTDCKGGLVCLTLPGLCGDKQADGLACKRNAECQNQCNSFSGLCTLGKAGTLCTLSNPDGDCVTGLSCIDCAGSYTCRPTGTPCM